jgi:hypothetical protein
MDRKKIIETFERIEREAGGTAEDDAPMTLSKTAIEVGVSRDIVRSVMIDHWTMRGAG